MLIIAFIDKLIANNGVEVRTNMSMKGFPFDGNLTADTLLERVQSTGQSYEQQVKMVAEILNIAVSPSGQYAQELHLKKQQYGDFYTAIIQMFKTVKATPKMADNPLEKALLMVDEWVKNPKNRIIIYGAAALGGLFAVAAVIKIIFKFFK